MKKVLTALVFVSLEIYAQADHVILSTEDRSGLLQEEPYTKAAPGMFPPAAYIERAKQAVHNQYKDVHFNMYSGGKVTRRFYSGGLPADRDLICVMFIYEEVVPKDYPGWSFNGTFPFRRAILALIRKNLSKIISIKQIYISYRP
jgi:hypothetical protein